jgi:hypothetical protein
MGIDMLVNMTELYKLAHLLYGKAPLGDVRRLTELALGCIEGLAQGRPMPPLEALRDLVGQQEATACYEIVVNGRRVVTDPMGPTISYEGAVALSKPETDSGALTVAWSHRSLQISGTLIPGQSTRIYDEMVFNIARTG